MQILLQVQQRYRSWRRYHERILSFAITEKIRAGVAVQEACEQCLLQHLRRLESLGYGNGGMSVIAMDKEGSTEAQRL